MSAYAAAAAKPSRFVQPLIRASSRIVSAAFSPIMITGALIKGRTVRADAGLEFGIASDIGSGHDLFSHIIGECRLLGDRSRQPIDDRCAQGRNLAIGACFQGPANCQ
jgi:hypothetical protein